MAGAHLRGAGGRGRGIRGRTGAAPGPDRRHGLGARGSEAWAAGGRGGLAYALPLALLHGGATLATLALVQDGRFAPDVGGLALPVLGLEASLAWFVVAFVLGAQSGRRILGEGTLTLALPVVGVGVAIAGVLMPALVPAFFILTAPMLATAARRFERVEVTW